MSALRELEVIRQMDAPRFTLSYMRSRSTGETEIILEGKTAGRHRARHYSVDILDDDGRLVEARKIDDTVADFVFEHFLQRGDTESFRIHESDLKAGRLLPRKAAVTRPDEVRHQLTDAERSFTANSAHELRTPVASSGSTSRFSTNTPPLASAASSAPP